MPKEPLKIAYVMKGFPRISETFILNEVYWLETFGLDLRIFSAFRPERRRHHPITEEIQAEVTYLPEAVAAVDREFFPWLRANLPRYLPSHLRLILQAPWRYARTLLEALSLSVRCRKRRLGPTKKVFYKDFLRSGFIAQELLSSGEVQHLHAHFCHGSTTMAMFASRLSRIPFSFTAHAKDIYLRRLNPGDLLSKKIERAQFIVTCTESNRQHLLQLRPDTTDTPDSTATTPVHTIYHGVDTTRFVPAKGGPKIPIILSVGRLVEKKGFVSLVRACDILRSRGCRFICRIVGDAGDQSEPVKSLIEQLELQTTVRVEAGIPQDELLEIYRKATLFALPCQVLSSGDRDGIPNVLVEAMSMRIPVVASAISGIPELISDRDNGLLVPENDVTALADAIQELLSDSELRASLGRAARDTICRRFDARKNTMTLNSLFSQELRSHVGG